MLLPLAMALAIQSGVPMPQRTTPVGSLASCDAKDLDEAANCLREKLSESDRIALVGSPVGGGVIRGEIDRFVQYEFRLYEPNSKVGNWLRERGIDSRMVQSSVIIDEYLYQQRGSTLDLRKIAKAAHGMPDGTPPTAGEFSGSEFDPTPSIKISREECAKITKLPPDQLGECFTQGDHINVTRIEKKSAN
ncbi:MAG: hypothetical protein M3438_02010 [Pseudomonadota bacterium]|nr:hypothetical protein [Sphingomonas sp.]MDQ3477928.1 hypothetical protein [Pseudomonadota bacterium]